MLHSPFALPWRRLAHVARTFYPRAPGAARAGRGLQRLPPQPMPFGTGGWAPLWQPAALLAACSALVLLSLLGTVSAGLMVLCGALILAIAQQVFGIELSLVGTP
jgi:hypothetical protein